MRIVNHTGQKVGRLTFVKYSHSKKGVGSYWECRCECGKIKVIDARSIIRGNTLSCGCLHSEYSSSACKQRNTKHNKSKNSKLYNLWKTMRQRCNNPNCHDFKWYGGCGIKISEIWSDFENFYSWSINSGYQSGLTIERIDGKKDYCPENCKWVTIQEQQNNRRNNILVDWKGKRLTITDLSRESGVERSLLYNRIVNLKWNVDKSVSKTKISRKKKG